MRIPVSIFLLVAMLLFLGGCGGARVGTSYPIGRTHVGISVPVFPSWGNRILHYQSIFEAAANGDTYDIKTHLLRGAAVNSRDNEGRTPLHLAAMNGHYKASKYLISKGGYVDGLDGSDRTPYDYARENGHEEVEALLSKYGGK